MSRLIPYAIGALILGAVGLAVGDFALQWQPVPASVPFRAALAYLSAVILITGAGLSLAPKHMRLGVALLGSFYASWVLSLHLPRVIQHPADVSMWLGVAEILALATGGCMAWARSRAVLKAAWIVFGACLLVFGISHVVYADFTASMIPRWLPVPLFWAYLTGAGHVAAGLAFISGIARRLAATLFTVMIACFVVLLHAPRVFADLGNRIEWTMLGIAIALTGAAWIARTVASR